jgi:glycosyltransferase involved in cell wall biosynthesis
MKKILLFATYTIANPQHGGQKRVRALYDAYKDSKSLEPYFCAIYYPPHYKESWDNDIAIPKSQIELLEKNPLTGEVIIGKIIKNNVKTRKKIIRLINEIKPDIIEIEHPFLYIGLKHIFSEIGYTGKIIYSSHNIEYSMKQEILENENYNLKELETIIKEIKDAEIELCKKADLIFAVSEDDIAGIAKLAGQKNKTVLARNGIEKQKKNIEQEAYWDKYFYKKGVKKIALFVGSAHPPNWTGFQAMVGSKIGFLNQDERIVLAGSIGEYFANTYSFSNLESVLFWKRIMSVGRLSEDQLTGLIGRADCLILPITEGGGSNLKTAEALISYKPVVATKYAMRAFEDFTSYPTVNVSNEPSEFRNLVANAIRNEKTELSQQEKKELEKVTWKSCLKEAVLAAEAL